MKATGIVRRIDDLGRIVIPKELRRVMGVHQDDPLEFFTQKDSKGQLEIVLCKYYQDENHEAQGAVKTLKQFLENWEKSEEHKAELNEHIMAISRILKEDAEQKN